jgi:hypothetical protein
MKHLTDTELVDLIAGALESDRAAHADGCVTCRAHAEALRAVMTDEVPEPSPLFWDHLAARVSDAVRDEAPDPEPGLWPGWLRSPAITWAMAASLAILLMVAGVWRTTLHAPTHGVRAGSAPPAGPATAPDGASAAMIDDLEADEAWAVVRTAAEGLEWDDARAAGISPRPGSAERVALELTADERSELARLLATEMKRSGA